MTYSVKMMPVSSRTMRNTAKSIKTNDELSFSSISLAFEKLVSFFKLNKSVQNLMEQKMKPKTPRNGLKQIESQKTVWIYSRFRNLFVKSKDKLKNSILYLLYSRQATSSQSWNANCNTKSITTSLYKSWPTQFSQH